MQGWLSPEEVAATGQRPEQLMEDLVATAAERAIPPISGFRVGCVGLGVSGALYLGYNLEFPGQCFQQTIHAEQFVVALAALRGEPGLRRLTITAAPCGHCRQFLAELERAEQLRIQVCGQPETTLGALLPQHFGPADLGVRPPLLACAPHPWAGPAPEALAGRAWEAARHSYAPYSGCPAGVAFEAEGRVFAGGLLENAAYNPSLAPLLVALVDYYSQFSQAPVLARVHLAEVAGPASQRWATESLLQTLAPGLELGYSQISQ